MFLLFFEHHLITCSGEEGTKASSPTSKTRLLLVIKHRLPALSYHLYLYAVLLGFPFRIEKNHCISYASSWSPAFQSSRLDLLQYHIQANSCFHSTPLVNLPITFLPGSKFPESFLVSLTKEVTLNFPNKDNFVSYTKNYTQCNTSSLYKRNFRQHLLRTLQ